MIDFSKELALSLLGSGKEYPVDFEDAWQWLGYSSKQAAKKKLTRNFEQEEDYLSEWMKTPDGGRPSESIYLTVDCFKALGIDCFNVLYY